MFSLNLSDFSREFSFFQSCGAHFSHRSFYSSLGTTLDFIKMRLPNGVTMIDTPGLLTKGQLTSKLNSEELRQVRALWILFARCFVFVTMTKCALIARLGNCTLWLHHYVTIFTSHPSIIGLLFFDCVQIIPAKPINPITLRVVEGKTILIGGVARVELLEVNHSKHSVSDIFSLFFVPLCNWSAE